MTDVEDMHTGQGLALTRLRLRGEGPEHRAAKWGDRRERRKTGGNSYHCIPTGALGRSRASTTAIGAR